MAYKPFANAFSSFSPFNHFDDDVLKFYYPYVLGARAHLYRPYWVPEIFGGIAMYANTYASHFSPLNWILTLGPLAVTYPLKLLMSVWIAGLSMFSFARSLRLSSSASFLAGLAYMFSSIFMGLLLRWWLHAPFSWFPFVLLFAFRAQEKKDFFSIFASAVFLAFAFCDGFLQSSAAIVLALGVFLSFSGYRLNKWRGFSEAVGIGTAILIFGFLFSAIMWLPQLEYFIADIAKGGSRMSGAYYGKNLTERLLSIPLLVAAFFPQEIGSVHTMDLAKFARSNLQDFSLFIGTIPLLLGIASWRKKSSSAAIFACRALLVLGIIIPVFTFLDRYFYFRFFAVYVSGISLLAGFGFDALRGESDRKGFVRICRWTGIFTGILAAASGALRAFLWLKPGWLETKVHFFISNRLDQSTLGSRNPEWMLERASRAIQYWSLNSWEYNIPLLLTAIAVGICLLWAKKRIQDNAFIGASIVLTLLQLGIYARDWHGFHDLTQYPLFPVNEISRFLHTEDPSQKFRSTVDDFNGIGKEKQLIPSNSNYAFQYSTLEGFDGLRPAVVYDLPVKITDYRTLGARNVRYILTNSSPLLESKDLILRHRGAVAIYENRLVRSRGQIFYNYEVISEKESKTRVARGESPDLEKPWLESEPSLSFDRTRLSEDAELIGSDFQSSKYRLKNQASGIFVASESFYPGWTAELNGQPLEIKRANYTMRGVIVPAGGGELIFRFAPYSYKLGLFISLGSFLFAACALLLSLVLCNKPKSAKIYA